MTRAAATRLGAYAIALVAFVTAAVRALADGWFPIGDGAQLYIRATDVLTADHPWLGSGTSASVSLGYQVNNAGPLYFDLVAPFARTLPAGPGNVVAVTLINAACLVLAGLAARRIGGHAHGRIYEAWVLAAGAVLAWTLGSELLFDMFQAHALLFPFLATCVLLTGVAAGQAWVWPWLAFVLTLIAQTHVSYAYILVVVVVTSIATALVGLPAPRGAALRAAVSGHRRTLGVTAIVLAVTWFQPLWQQLFGDGAGNLWRLARSAGGGDVAVGLPNAVRLVAAFVSLPPWAGRQGFAGTLDAAGQDAAGDRVVLVNMPPDWLCAAALLVTVGLLVAAWWWARRHGPTLLATLAAWSAVVLVGSVVALSRLTVSGLGLAPHHTRWLFVVALFVYLTLAWATCAVLAGHFARLPEVDTLASVVAGLALVAATLANLPKYSQRHGPTATTAAMPALRATFDAIDAMIDAGTWPDPVYYDVSNERIYAPHSSAIQLHLRERGATFRVSPEFLVRQLGEYRRADGTEAATIVQFQAWDAISPPAGCIVASTSGDAATDAANVELAGGLVDELSAALADGTLAVTVPDDADPIDVGLAARLPGVRATLSEVTLDGRLRYWADQGWVTALPGRGAEAVARLRADGPALTTWTDSMFALVITDRAGCRE